MSFQATIKKSGHTFKLEEGKDILQSALDSGLMLPHGCKSGQCGSCRAQILEGNISYPDGTPAGLSKADEEKNLALLCQARPNGDLVIDVKELNSNSGIEPRILPVRVVESEKLSSDVMRLMLALPKGQKLEYQAGQYIDVLLAGGKRRAFSIANAPRDDAQIELHIRHVDGGDFTGWVFNTMKERALLRIEGPLGGFFLQDASDKNLILAGGGTGFAPLKGMLEELQKSNNQRNVQLFWGVRARNDLYMIDLLNAWAEQYDWLTIIPVLSEPDDQWNGMTGWVHDAIVSSNSDLSGSEIYLSGPPAMIKAARPVLFSAGLNEDDLYYDAFEFASDVPVTNTEVV